VGGTKGKTYEQIYGVEKAKELKGVRSAFFKGRPSHLKGKTYEEIHGVEKAKELKEGRSRLFRGRPSHLKGKTGVSPMLRLEVSRKVSDSLKSSKKNMLKQCSICGKTIRGLGLHGHMFFAHNERGRQIARNKAVGFGEQVSVWQKEIWDRPGYRGMMREKLTGRMISDEARVNCSIGAIKRVIREGNKTYVHGRGGYREDLGHYVRSSWEANVCRLMNYFGIKYEYEKAWFEVKYGDKSFRYAPDLYLPEFDRYVEIKGFLMKPESGLKILGFIKDHDLILVGEQSYYILARQFMDLVPNWERGKLKDGK